MKKARFMLAAIAVLGLVGGTLAFKAHNKFTPTHFYTLTTSYDGLTFPKPECVPAFVNTVVNGVSTTTPFFTTTTTVTNTAVYYTPVLGQTVYCTGTLTGLYPALGE